MESDPFEVGVVFAHVLLAVEFGEDNLGLHGPETGLIMRDARWLGDGRV